MAIEGSIEFENPQSRPNQYQARVILKAMVPCETNNPDIYCDSEVTVGSYWVHAGRYGQAVLAPYYHGQTKNDAYSSKMVNLDLRTQIGARGGYRPGEDYSGVRIFQVFTDFADYYSEEVIEGRSYRTGTSPYASKADGSGFPQAMVQGCLGGLLVRRRFVRPEAFGN